MAKYRQITIDGRSFSAPRGQLLLDAALNNGIDLPYDCRSGHCGTCCVRLVSGDVHGGQGAEPGIVHACQCRILGDAVVERTNISGIQTVDGVLSSLRSLAHDVVEIGIKTDRALPYHAGQYAQVRFDGFPSRPFSLTHPLSNATNAPTISFHVRRMTGGCVTPALGKRIRAGHRVAVTGPFGSAHFRPNLDSRMILVATSTGFAPIWSIAVAALREDPERKMMIIAGGRSLETLYMAPALVQLSGFRNVVVVPVCSTPQTFSSAVKFGRPTDYLPRLLPTDVLYACGAPAMVDAVKTIAAHAGATCYADPFLPTAGDGASGADVLTRAKGWLSLLKRRQTSRHAASRPGNRRKKAAPGHRMIEPRMDNHTSSQSL